jgi:Rieske 2Fe-2S family protein
MTGIITYHPAVAFQPRAALPRQALTLPARYYVDPAIFARERDRFDRRMWVAVGRIEDIPSRGDYFTRTIAGDSVIVLRAGPEPHDVRAFFNVCRHRGTRLCDAPRGRLGAAIQCPYHAWTYDFDGRLAGAPHMDGTAGFRREDYPLGAARASVWGGTIFVSLDPSGPSLADYLGPLPAKFADWRIDTLVRAHQVEYDVAANWKLIVQNYNECLHCPTLHPALNKLSHYLSGENEPLRPTYMGGRMDLNPGVMTMSMDGTCPRDPLPGLSKDDRRHVYYYSIFPNFMIAPHPDYVLTHTLWPESPSRTRIACDWLAPRSLTTVPALTMQDAIEFWDLTNRQDWRVCELAQAGISSPAYRPGPYSNREDLLYAFDRFVVDTLGDI